MDRPKPEVTHNEASKRFEATVDGLVSRCDYRMHGSTMMLVHTEVPPQLEGRGIYLVINDGGDRKSEITACRAFFVEWDDRPIDWQLNAWRELGLPEPSLIVLSGGQQLVLTSDRQPSEIPDVDQRLLSRLSGGLV